MTITKVVSLKSDQEFYDNCIDDMQSPDTYDRICGRMNRDITPVLTREMTDPKNKTNEVISSAASVMTSMIATIAMHYACAGNEKRLAHEITQKIGECVALGIDEIMKARAERS